MTTLAPSTESTVGIRSIAGVGHDDIPFAGGKGANLGELTRAHLPVPPGFVVGAPAYAAFCEARAPREHRGPPAGTRGG